MGVLKSICRSEDQITKDSAKARTLLEEVKSVLPSDFVCAGEIQLYLSDLVKAKGETFEPSYFYERIQLGGNIVGSDEGRFAGGPTRITLNRWKDGADGVGMIKVGKSDLNSTSLVSYTSVTIGDRVQFEPRVVVMDCDGHPVDRRLPDVPANKKMAPVCIEDDVYIGYGAIITKGVTVGKGAWIMAGSLVTRDVPAGAKVMGNPARIIEDQA